MPAPSDRDAVEVVAAVHHAWITGLVLTLVGRAGSSTAEEFVFRLFRHQHLEKFLPGLEKLGLAGEPHAVAAAKYHYLSNQLGGVKVEYLEESPRKAWVRYPPPRWIWAGTAICAVPSNVNRAMLRGWHAHNGVSLGNPRLGFVCTGTTVDGQAGLEGYYQEYDHPLAPGERLVFRPEERCPPIDPGSLPALAPDAWPRERRAKAYRAYAMEYVRSALPVLVSQLGPEHARHLGRLCALQIGMHQHDELRRALGREDGSFVDLAEPFMTHCGDEVERGGDALRVRRVRLFRDLDPHPAVWSMWLALYEGMLAAHDRFAELVTRHDGGDLLLEIRRPASR